ncbi:MAG: SDR family oxidoreductase [Actinomycetota bacterium]|nr:SDR family oxidoreductase [Actinomycetota bacterium]
MFLPEAAAAALVPGRLAGKTAIITGAGSGLGRATAERYVAEGARVLVADIDGSRAAAVCERLGDAAVPTQVDVSDETAVAAMVQAALDAFGAVNVLFSNAGVAESVKPLAEISSLEWDRIIDINLKAFFLCAQAVAPQMRAADGGAMIVTASIAARRPRPGMAAYVASKAGVIGLARALAVELAGDGIRVNVLNPGPAQTPMLKEFSFAASEAEALRMLGEALPLGRAIQPADIAAAAVYLASDEACNVTGLVMNIDGGRDL